MRASFPIPLGGKMLLAAFVKPAGETTFLLSSSVSSIVDLTFQNGHCHTTLLNPFSHTAMELTTSNLIKLLLLLYFLPCFHTKSPPASTLPLPTKSGYLPVNPTTNSAMFYTFYEAQNPISPLTQTPLVIWLQGGPGCSSMIGNFLELGPWRLNRDKHLQLEPNLGAWNRIFGLLFLDNPVGTGFSVASSPKEIPTDQYSVAKHLFFAIRSFIELDPLFKSRSIYITGESYAGKYVPAIGYHILKKNSRLPESQRVNLRGVAIGNGLTDPVRQVATHAASAYFSGLINGKQKTQLEKAQLEAVKLIKEGNWSEATNARNRVLNMLQDMTGLATLYDLTRKVPYEFELVGEFLSSEGVKKALGANVSIAWEDCSDVVGEALHEDVMKSVKFMVELLVKKSKVLLYQGQFDLRDGVVSTEAWMKSMKWEGIDKFQAAERKVWEVKGELAGYVQKWGSLSHVVVSGAGHLVPADQPVNSQIMIEDWVLERGLFGNEQERN